MNDFDLISSFSLIDNFDHTNEYTRFDHKRNSYTLIEGILLSSSLKHDVISSTIVHPHINTSDHLPVQITLNIDYENFTSPSNSVTTYIPWASLSNSETENFRATIR